MCTYFIAKAEHKLIGKHVLLRLPIATHHPHGYENKFGPTDNTALRLKHLLNR